MSEPVSAEIFDYEKAEPLSRKFNPRWISRIMFYGASAIFDAIGSQMLFEDSGPKNGITNEKTVGCNVVDQFGPGDLDGEKVTMRTILASGLVRITLWSYELPEDAVRVDAGRVVDPAVAINDLLIECASPLQEPGRRSGIQHISAQNTLYPLGS